MKESNMKSKRESEAESHFNRFKDMMKEILSMPKSELEKREEQWSKTAHQNQEEETCLDRKSRNASSTLN